MSTSSAFAASAADGEQDDQLLTTVLRPSKDAGVAIRAAGNKSSSTGTGSKASGTTAIPNGILKHPPQKKSGKENHRSSSRLQRDKAAAAAPERPNKQQKLQPAIATKHQSKSANALTETEAFLNQTIVLSDGLANDTAAPQGRAVASATTSSAAANRNAPVTASATTVTAAAATTTTTAGSLSMPSDAAAAMTGTAVAAGTSQAPRLVGTVLAAAASAATDTAYDIANRTATTTTSTGQNAPVNAAVADVVSSIKPATVPGLETVVAAARGAGNMEVIDLTGTSPGRNTTRNSRNGRKNQPSRVGGVRKPSNSSTRSGSSSQASKKSSHVGGDPGKKRRRDEADEDRDEAGDDLSYSSRATLPMSAPRLAPRASTSSKRTKKFSRGDKTSQQDGDKTSQQDNGVSAQAAEVAPEDEDGTSRHIPVSSSSTLPAPAATAPAARLPATNAIVAMHTSAVAAVAPSQEDVDSWRAQMDAAEKSNHELLAEHAELFDKVQSLLKDPLINVSDDLAARREKLVLIALPSDHPLRYVGVTNQNIELKQKILAQKSELEKLSGLRTNLQACTEQVDLSRKKLAGFQAQLETVRGLILSEQNGKAVTKQSVQSSNDKLKDLRLQSEAALHELREEEKNDQKIRETVASRESKCRALSDELEAEEARLRTEKAKADTSGQKVESSKAKLSKLKEQTDDTGKQARADRQKLESAQTKINEAMKEREVLKAEIESVGKQKDTEQSRGEDLRKKVLEEIFSTSQ